jgi:hypothetical protein
MTAAVGCGALFACPVPRKIGCGACCSARLASSTRVTSVGSLMTSAALTVGTGWPLARDTMRGSTLRLTT